MRVQLSVLAVAAVYATWLLAQQSPEKSNLQFQYGSSIELKGVTKIYVDTGTDLELRDQIVRNIQSQLKNLIAVSEKPEDADVVVIFDGGVRSLGDGLWKERWGNGSVVKLVDSHTTRLLLTYKRPKEAYRVGHHPADDFSQVFVEKYREANNLDRHNQPKRTQ